MTVKIFSFFDEQHTCDVCGYVNTDCSFFDFVDDIFMCALCKKDYRDDHPDIEELVARAEYLEER